jgi:hypothetical protein
MWKRIESPHFFTLPLVTDLPEKIVPPRDIRLSFYPLGRAAVDDAEHPAALLTLGNNNFNRVGGRTEYRAHLRHVSDRIHHIDGVRILHYQYKCVAATEYLSVAYSNIPKRLVISF